MPVMEAALLKRKEQRMIIGDDVNGNSENFKDTEQLEILEK